MRNDITLLNIVEDMRIVRYGIAQLYVVKEVRTMCNSAKLSKKSNS